MALIGVFNFKTTFLLGMYDNSSFKYKALYPITMGSPEYFPFSFSFALVAFSGSSVVISKESLSILIAICWVVLFEKIDTLLIAEIISFVLISCAKKDDSSSSSTTTYTTSTSGVTASGSITLGNYSISGTYATVCFSASDSTVPTDVTHLGFVVVVTSSDSYRRETNYYKDSTCTKAVSYTHLTLPTKA